MCESVPAAIGLCLPATCIAYIYITAVSCSHVSTEKKSVPQCSLTVTARAHRVCYHKPSPIISPCCYWPLCSCHMHSIYITAVSCSHVSTEKKACRIALSLSLRVAGRNVHQRFSYQGHVVGSSQRRPEKKRDPCAFKILAREIKPSWSFYEKGHCTRSHLNQNKADSLY